MNCFLKTSSPMYFKSTAATKYFLPEAISSLLTMIDLTLLTPCDRFHLSLNTSCISQTSCLNSSTRTIDGILFLERAMAAMCVTVAMVALTWKTLHCHSRRDILQVWLES